MFALHTRREESSSSLPKSASNSVYCLPINGIPQGLGIIIILNLARSRGSLFLTPSHFSSQREKLIALCSQ